MAEAERDWRRHGVRVVTSERLDFNTPQTPGMTRAAAIDRASAGAEKLWAGTVEIHPNAKTGAHHHGALESVIYVVRGRARMRWGDRLEFVAEAGPGDFIYVPPYVPHQEINASREQPLQCVLVRSDQEPVVVNLDIPVAEEPEEVDWVDPIHPGPQMTVPHHLIAPDVTLPMTPAGTAVDDQRRRREQEQPCGQGVVGYLAELAA